MARLLEWTAMLIERGGPVMYPLVAVSVISLALIFERGAFWLAVRRNSPPARLRELNAALRLGKRKRARQLIAANRTPYDHVARAVLEQGASDAVAVEAVQHERPRFDRFMVSLSTIITAAPLLGILGTVMGIIQSFQLLGVATEAEGAALTDPRQVSGGIAQALITTAFGLIVALFTLFPYMAFRAQVERALNRLESLIASAQQGEAAEPDRPGAQQTVSARAAEEPPAPSRIAARE